MKEETMQNKEIIIVGAGASGLIAAVTAARAGARVTVLEQNDRPGKKIGATGNGRCNLTNLNTPPDAYRGTDPSFVQEALAQFGVQDTIRFFSELGIYTTNRNGYLYPRSGQAQSVTDVLCMEAAHLGVRIKTRETVTKIVRKDRWVVYTEGWHYEGGAVILANGSKASAISGSDGSGYAIAEALGHNIVPVYPALTALKCKGNDFKAWAGVRTEGEITLCINDFPAKSEKGELQLTDYGISGIPVMQLSRYAIRALHEGCSVRLLVNFLPEFTKEGLNNYLEYRKACCPYKTDKELLTGLFPDKLIRVLTAKKDLVSAISAFPLTVREGMDFDKAQVCSGGVATAEVNASTMESLLCPGLYFAGELLDIDGTCGGYNLQWAWSSGVCAGSHAARTLSDKRKENAQ